MTLRVVCLKTDCYHLYPRRFCDIVFKNIMWHFVVNVNGG